LTSNGKVRARAKFNQTLSEEVVIGQHGWWQACRCAGLSCTWPRIRKLQRTHRQCCCRSGQWPYPHPICVKSSYWSGSTCHCRTTHRLTIAPRPRTRTPGADAGGEASRQAQILLARVAPRLNDKAWSNRGESYCHYDGSVFRKIPRCALAHQQFSQRHGYNLAV
jgi:hypothetical protein